jgi:hypothetical protein
MRNKSAGGDLALRDLDEDVQDVFQGGGTFPKSFSG